MAERTERLRETGTAPVTSPRVVCCGEALIDLIATDDRARTWRAVPGGSPYNAAVAASRLGAPTTFVGVLSEDRFGTVLTEHLDASHVDHRTCPRTSEPTTLAVVSAPKEDGEADFGFHVAGTATVSARVNDLHLPVDMGIFQTSGSVSFVLEPAASRLEALLAAARHRSLVVLDPNPRPAIAGSRDAYVPRLRRWLSLVDVVRVSAHDLAWIYPGSAPEDIARGWVRRDREDDDVPAVVVLTRGADGASVLGPDLDVSVQASAHEVVDTVGAGDSFTGALLAAFSAHHIDGRAALERLDAAWWRTALTFAVTASGITCTRVGADPPWRRELAAAPRH